jgi:Xaa-Pro aminopeptidase
VRYVSIDSKLFTGHRQRLAKMLQPNSLAVVNANDAPPTNADGSLLLHPNSDLFYLTGVEQEETVLLLYPDAHEEKFREILFLREPNALMETWEGHKLGKDEARKISGVARVEWLSDFRSIFHRLMCECDHAYLNTNEHKRASSEVETREDRFVAETLRRYPLHDYQRLARQLHRLRIVKSAPELEILQRACDLTGRGFRRVLKMTKPGVKEVEIEAELVREFTRGGGKFAYPPIVASGRNTCVLHYVSNDRACKSGDLILLDVGAAYANYNSDMTRTIPASGRFTRRQKQVYNAVLRVLRGVSAAARPGKLPRDWQKEAEALVEKELVDLGLLKMAQIRKQNPDSPALKKYFMHGVGHPIGLDVHDVGLTTEPIQVGWVLTVEPGIYIPEEGFGIRLENNVVVTADGQVDLMAEIPIEADEIEELMKR